MPVPTLPAETVDRMIALRNGGATVRAAAEALGLPTDPHSLEGYKTLVNRRSRETGTPLVRRRAVLGRSFRFGVEVEAHWPLSWAGLYGTSAKMDRLADLLRAAGIDAVVESYNHSTRAHWKVTTDASTDVEVVSPILSGEAGLRQVRKVMAAMRAAGFHVTSRDGFHVHVEATRLSRGQRVDVLRRFLAAQDHLDRFVARSRRAQPYGAYPCGRLSTSDVVWAEEVLRGERIVRRNDSRRYRSVNVAPFCDYGTIEIRLHQGTLNGTKATAWITLLQAVFASARAGFDLPAGSDTATWLTALRPFGLRADRADYLAGRAARLARRAARLAR